MTFRRTLSAAAFCFGALAVSAAPAHIIISVSPSAAPGDLPRQLAAWRQAGTISAAQLLNVVLGARSAENVAPNPTLGAIAIVEFADEAALTRWQQSPASKLAPGMVATRVDLLSRLDVTPRDSKAAIFLIAEYDIIVPPARYREYVDGYVMPQMNAWKNSGLITSAIMFAARDRAGAPFHAMLLLEHRDAATFARRDAVKDESRKQLAADPTWKALSDVKATIRKEKFLTRAIFAELPSTVR
jgi:hypothetical protein